MDNLKRYPLTMGLILSLLAGAGAVWCAALRAQASAQEISDLSVSRHEQRDMVSAHPGAKRLEDKVDSLSNDMGRAREALGRIEGALRR